MTWSPAWSALRCAYVSKRWFCKIFGMGCSRVKSYGDPESCGDVKAPKAKSLAFCQQSKRGWRKDNAQNQKKMDEAANAKS